MFHKKNLHTIQEKFFNIFIMLSWGLLIISALGFSTAGTSIFLNDLDYYVRIYICLFLMWRFHPFRSHYEFTDLDRKIAFSAGLFILTTTTLNQYLLDVEKQLKTFL
jgi:hypothetical protein